MRSRLAVLLALSLAAACAEAPVARRPPVETARYSGWYRVLPSGLRLVVYERPGARHFHLGASYLGGTSADPEGQEGTAVLATRLALRARPGGVPLADRILAAGSRLEASTSRMDLVFEQEGRLSALRSALEVERDRLLDPLAGVTEEEFLEAREALALELALEQDRGDEEVHLAALLREILPANPGARPRGTPTSARALTMEGVQAWARTQLTPSRLVLVLTGPGRPEDAARSAVEILGSAATVSGGAPEVPGIVPAPPPPKPELPVVRETSDGPRLWLAWILPGDVAARAVAVEAAGAVVRAAAGARVEKADLAPAVRGEPEVHTVRLPEGAVVALGVGLRADRDAEAVAEALRKEVGRFAASPETAAGLGWLGDRLRRLAFLRGEGVDVAEAARWLRETGQADYLAGHQTQLAGMGMRGLPPSAVGALSAPSAHALLVLPLSPAAPDLEAAAFIAGAAAEPPASGATPGPEAVRALLADPAFALHRRTLPNGLEVVVAPVGEHPTAVARLVLRTPHTGSNGFPTGLPFLALVTAEKEWSFLGRLSCPGAERLLGPEAIGFRVAGAAAELPSGIEALGCATRSSAVGGHFRELRDHLVKSLRRREVQAQELGFAALYPNHPYGTRPDPEVLAEVRAGQAERWLERVLRPDRATLVISGKVAPGPELDRQVDAALGGWKARGEPLAEPAAPEQAPGKILLVPGRRAAALVLAAVRLTAGDREAGLALAHLLAARLRAALPREAQALASTRLVEARHGRVVSVSALCEKSQAAATIATILAEVRRLAGGAVAPAEAARARWLVARDLAPRHDTAAQAVADLAAAVERGLPLDDAARVDSVATLSAERIGAEARLLATGREVVTVLGDRNLLPALQAAGLAVEVVEPPAEAKPGP